MARLDAKWLDFWRRGQSWYHFWQDSPDTPTPPTPGLKFGCLGDSGTDAFRGTDDRGGAYGSVTFNPIEILTRLRNFDMGAWGNYAEPRRTDYAYNYSRTAATSHTMISQGQHTGLAAQIAAGNVEYAFIRIGANDFYAGYASNYEAVYNNTLSGAALTAEINSCIADVLTALDALRTAGAHGVVCQLFPLTPDATAAALGWTDAAGRDRVTAAINSINAGLISGFNSRSIPYTDPNAVMDHMVTSGTFGSRTWNYWNQTMYFDATGDDPLHTVIADNVHAGTVLNALLANMQIVDPLNSAYGLGIKRLRPWEVLALVSISSGISGSLRRA